MVKKYKPFPSVVLYAYQSETVAEGERQINEGTVAAQTHGTGLSKAEPLIVIADSLLRYAKAYAKRQGQGIENDGYASDYFADMVRGLRGLLSMPGGLAMEKDLSGDSFDGGVVDTVLMEAWRIGGYSQDDL